MIEEIYLENWKSHEKSHIIFDKINLIIGRMGSGKTSITDAISFTLFGTFSDLVSKKMKLEDVIMKKPREKKIAKVILKCKILGKNFEIHRYIEKDKGSYAEIKDENNRVIRSGTTDVNEFIKKMLKMDYQTFINVAYSEQNKIEFFLNLERGERKVRFDQMIGIERLERIRKTCISLKNRLTDIHKEKENLLSKLILEDLDKNIKDILNKIKELENKNLELENVRINTIEEIEDVKKKCEEGKKVENEVKEIEKKIINISTKIEENKKFLNDLQKEIGSISKEIIEEEILEIDKKIQSLKSEIYEFDNITKKLKEEKESLSKKLLEHKQLMERKAQIEKKLNELSNIEKDFEEVNNLIEEDKVKLRNLDSKLIGLRLELEKEKKLVEILSEKFSLCPICESEIGDEKRERILKKHKEIISECIKNIEAIEDEIETIEKNIEINEKKKENLSKLFFSKKSLEEELKSISDLKEEIIEEFSKKIAELENEIKKREEIINLKREEIIALEYSKKDKISKKDKLNKKFLLEKEIETLSEDLKKLNDRLSYLTSNENYKKLKEHENELKRLEIYLEKINSEIQNNKKMIDLLAERKREIEKRIEIREKMKKEKEYLERVINDLSILEICVKETQLIVRSSLIDAINYYLSMYWRKIYPYQDYIDARFIATEDDYILQVKDSLGRWVELDKVASGGERTLAAICLRIAFSKVLNPILNIIIFDEPTHNLDEEAIIKFAKIINESFAEIFNQVFIITHDERFKSLVSGNIIKVERNKIDDLPSKVIFEE
ncbi:MAG: SMC family ATPase [Candidatus Aenigmatarchaeota archaeon]